MLSSKSQYWEDVQTNKLYKIDKQNGIYTPIKRDLSIRTIFNNDITGKAKYLDRIRLGKQQTLPKIPDYLAKQTKVLNKYSSKIIQNKIIDQLVHKKKKRRKILNLQNQLTYNIINEIEKSVNKGREQNRKKFLQKSNRNLDRQQNTNSNKLELIIPDDSDFFKLTRYYTQKKTAKQKYKLISNPETNDYLKPVPMHHHSLINRSHFQKQEIIEKLQTSCCNSKNLQEKKPLRKAKTQQKGNFNQLLKNSQKISKLRELKQKFKLGIEYTQLQMKNHKEMKNRLMIKKLAQRKQKLLMQNLFLKMQENENKRKFKSLIEKLSIN